MIELTVVIPVRNGESTLGQQLDELLPQQWDGIWEVLVVDNASDDRTAEIVTEYMRSYPHLRMIHANDGRGVNFARNRGIEQAHADHIAICDGDDIVASTWVKAMGDALRNEDCVTGPIDAQRLNPPWLVRTRGLFPSDAPREYYGIFKLAAGGNMAIRRSAWLAVGRFREDIVGAVDDIEFCLRMWQHGFEIGFAPKAMIHYRYRAEPSALWHQGRFYGKGKPLIARLLHEAGLATPSRFAGWKSWLLLVLWAPRVFTLEGRAAWCWVAGNRVGQLQGCWIHKAFWL